jgi:hypothetical protein
MSPILGSKGSLSASAYGFTSSTGALGSYDSISTATVTSGGTTTITFSSIPSTYTHLQLRILGRSTFVRGAGSTLPVSMYMKIGNGGTIQSTNYYYHDLRGDGATAVATGSSFTSAVIANNAFPAANATSGIFGQTIVDILDYTSTVKNKTFRSLAGVDQNGSGLIGLFSALYFGTPLAITDIQLTTDGDFAQYSSFALYGIK